MQEQDPLLLTGKLRIPQSIPGVIHRTELETRFLKALEHISLFIVTAPAGFGKTTIVSQSLKDWGFPIAWLQLDIEDNDPVQFWTYLTAALRVILPDLPTYAQSIMASPDSPQSLIRIANYLETVSVPFALVLDDFHHIASEVIFRQLEWFINRGAPALRLIVISRNESPLSVARLQVRHNLETIDVEALRFTPTEVRAFLKDTMSLAVDNNLINQLTQLTEGWPAALHLMALRLRHQPKAFSSNERFAFPDANITHYFDEEVFGPLPPEVQDFLLRTSILKDIQPDLCQAVAGIDGHHFLEELARNQSFVTRLDNSGMHYRYHSLFMEYLQARLKRDHPEWLQEAHRKAATYYQKHKMMELAVEHALVSGDFTYTEALISDTAWSLISLGKRDTVRNWLEKIPAQHLENNPRLSVYYAWVLFLQGHFDQVEHYLLLADNWLSLKAHLLTKYESQTLKGEISIIRAMIAHFAGHLKQAIEMSQQALQSLPEDQTFLRGIALGSLGYAQLMDTDTAIGENFADNDFVSIHRDELSRLLVQCNQANMLVLLGHLHEAHLLFKNIVATAQTDPQTYQIVTAVAYFGIGLLEFAWNDLDQAAEHVREALKLGQPWIYMNTLLPAYLTLARIEQTRNHYKAADQALAEMESHIQTGHLTQMRELLELNYIRIKMMRGDFASARKWMLRSRNHEEAVEFSVTGIWRYITYAEVLIEDNTDQALQVLNQLNAQCGLLSLMWLQMDIQLMQCITYWRLEQEAKALSLLQNILARAEPEGHIRLFLDRGPIIEKMLRKLPNSMSSSIYTNDLLRAFEAESKRAAGVSSDLVSSTAIERLSSRELEILSLIAKGATNKDIAERLIIAEGTVKTHVKHILHKLDAQNRTDAIAKARSLTLIS